jgi:hypothetical protein
LNQYVVGQDIEHAAALKAGTFDILKVTIGAARIRLEAVLRQHAKHQCLNGGAVAMGR